MLVLSCFSPPPRSTLITLLQNNQLFFTPLLLSLHSDLAGVNIAVKFTLHCQIIKLIRKYLGEIGATL